MQDADKGTQDFYAEQFERLHKLLPVLLSQRSAMKKGNAKEVRANGFIKSNHLHCKAYCLIS